MTARPLVTLAAALTVSGCSFYDVATTFEDSVFGTGFFSDEMNPNHPDWNGSWDIKVSQCIRHEKAKQKLARQLDAAEDGKDFVVLPTGEIYPVENTSMNDGSSPGPTEICRSRYPE